MLPKDLLWWAFDEDFSDHTRVPIFCPVSPGWNDALRAG
jgi:hypothetical protein